MILNLARVLVLLSSLTVLAEDDVVVVVNAAVPQSVTLADIKKMYLGRLREIEGLKMVPIDLEGSSPERDEFLQKAIGQAPMLFDRYWTAKSYADGSKPPERHPAAAVLALVQSEKGAVAYARRSAAIKTPGVRVNERSN